MARHSEPAEGWSTLALLAGHLILLFHSVAIAGWGDGFELLPLISLFGTVIGFVAAKSRLRTIPGMLLGVSIGCLTVLASRAVAVRALDWTDRLSEMSARLWGWYWLVQTQGPTYDPFAFASATTLAAYVLGFCASWLVFRLQSGWLALVLNGSVGIIHLSYVGPDSLAPFLLSLFCGVLVVASQELNLRQYAWRSIGVPVQRASLPWTLACAAALAGTSLVMAFQLPAGYVHAELAARYDVLTLPWRDAQRQIDRVIGGGRGQGRAGATLVFGQSLVPRSSFELGDRPILRVSASQPPYLRGAVYDAYDGRSIAATSNEERRLEALEELPKDPTGPMDERPVEHRVTLLTESTAIAFAANRPAAVDLDVIATLNYAPWDIAALRFATPIQRGQSYRVVSHVSSPIVQGEAQIEHPGWLRPYLALPPDLPERVHALAKTIGEGESTAYGRALAVERYVRGVEYSVNVPVPPPDRDWVDYVLFESRLGYCDYLAVSMMVLLRSQGMPARVVSGFAPGIYDEAERSWLVREREAHSWVEAYLPGHGWTAFEPSATRSVPDRDGLERRGGSRGASGALDDLLDDGGVDVGDDPTGLRGTAGRLGGASMEGFGLVLVGLALLLVLVGALVVGVAARWESGLPDSGLAGRRYAQMVALVRLGGWPLPSGATSAEIGTLVGAEVPAISDHLKGLVQDYVAATYGRRNAGIVEVEESEWPTVRGALFKAAVTRRVAVLGSRVSIRRRSFLTVHRASTSMPPT